ncbi:MAG: leucine-rich repeat protein, partial [Candidatus Poribacteria bacterium]|nr:leucine-rich repeat protein [Candidatus Poribacteria bacterium]
MKNSFTTKQSKMTATKAKLFTTSITAVLILLLTCLLITQAEATVLDSAAAATLIANQGNSVDIPNTYTSIGDDAFKNRGVVSASIPNSVTSIGTYAFAFCSELTSVTIPNSVISIGDYAFKDSSLTSVTIPDSVTSIGDDAFVDCHNLTSITIPDSVTSIGNNAFSNSGLASVFIQASETADNYPDFTSAFPSNATVTYQPLPRISSFTPSNNASDVPTEIYLELEFDQPMNRNSVMDSVIRLSRLDLGYQQQFNLPLNSVEASNLIHVEWSADDKKLTVYANSFKLDTGANYKVEMIENRAQGANGLPLNLTGDLLSGITFTTGSQEKGHQGQPGIVSITPQNGDIDVPTEIYLELTFTQPMDQGSVLDSVLRLS